LVDISEWEEDLAEDDRTLYIKYSGLELERSLRNSKGFQRKRRWEGSECENCGSGFG